MGWGETCLASSQAEGGRAAAGGRGPQGSCPLLLSGPSLTPPPPGRSIESPSLGFSSEAFLPHLLEDELGQFSDLEMELDSQNWQHTVGREAAAQLPQQEIDRQEVINGEGGGTGGVCPLGGGTEVSRALSPSLTKPPKGPS